MATYADGPGLDDDELAQLLGIYPHVIAEAKNGHNATGFVRLGARWHTPEAAVKFLRSGSFDSAKEDAADAIAAFERERPMHEAIREADARRETMLAAQRAENAAKAKVRVDRQAAADKRYEDAMVAAGLGARRA